MAKHQIPLPIYPDYHILCKNISTVGNKITVMIPISEEEEAEIDNIEDTTLTFTRGNRTFSVNKRNIYCYGEVDFKDDDTLDQIEEFNFLNFLKDSGIRIRSRYDYDSHTCTSTTKKCLWAETWSPSEIAIIAHGFLGKPKRILLFNQKIK